MFHLSSEFHLPKFITPGCTNHFFSLFIPMGFKTQLEPETTDSKAEELLSYPNQGNPIDRYERSLQVILEVKYYPL
ncbi:hypothetical protein CsatA_006882 [Cannabis sativa]